MVEEIEQWTASAWKAWKTELLKLAASKYQDYPADPVTDCGEQCWREAYDEGQTPEEALLEQRSCGD